MWISSTKKSGCKVMIIGCTTTLGFLTIQQRICATKCMFSLFGKSWWLQINQIFFKAVNQTQTDYLDHGFKNNLVLYVINPNCHSTRILSNHLFQWQWKVSVKALMHKVSNYWGFFLCFSMKWSPSSFLNNSNFYVCFFYGCCFLIENCPSQLILTSL